MSKLSRYTKKIQADGKEHKIEILHNLDDFPGVYVKAFAAYWVTQTNTYTNQSLCDYIMGKHELYVAMTEAQHEEMRFGPLPS